MLYEAVWMDRNGGYEDYRSLQKQHMLVVKVAESRTP